MKFFLTPILIIILFVCTPPHSVVAVNKLPLRVQMVLVKISPLFEKGQYEEAIVILNTFKKKKKGAEDKIHDHAEINFALGNCHMLLGELEKARNYYSDTVIRNQQHLSGWQNLAKTEYELENYIPASAAFHTSYDLTDKKDANLLYYCAVNLLMAQQYMECLNHFDTLLQQHQDAVTLAWKENLVYALIQEDKPKKALKYIVELADKFEGDKQQRWQEILLQQYMAMDMLKEAVDLVQILTRKAPTNPTWWKALTHIKLQQDHYDKALAALTIYSYLSPMKPDEEKLLGDLYLQQGVPQKAVIKYENYNKQEKNPQTVEALVRAYLSLGQPELALKKLEAFKANLKPQKCAMLQGEIYYAQKDFKRAAFHYNNAAKSTGNDAPRALLMTAYCYWQQGNSKDALKTFYKAAKTKQFKKEADSAIKLLEKSI